jgi:hypothetical protein
MICIKFNSIVDLYSEFSFVTVFLFFFNSYALDSFFFFFFFVYVSRIYLYTPVDCLYTAVSVIYCYSTEKGKKTEFMHKNYYCATYVASLVSGLMRANGDKVQQNKVTDT